MSTDEPDIERLRQMADAAHAFSFWQAEPVDDSPMIELCSWRVMELHNGHRHLVGTSLSGGSGGRVSSRIASFDAVRSLAVTDSGHVYRLLGSNGRGPDSDHVWHRWLLNLGSPAWDDVTALVVEAITSAQARDCP